MPKILKMYTLRYLIRRYPKQNYSTYRYIQKKFLPCTSRYFRTCTGQTFFNHTLSLLSDSSENVIKQLCSEFPEPKKLMSSVLNQAFLSNPSVDIKPTVSYEQFTSGDKHEYLWKATLHMKWPKEFDVEGIANKKSDAENIAFLYACQKLKSFGVLDRPVVIREKFNVNELSVKTAKGDLLNIFQRIWARSGKKEYLPTFSTIPFEGVLGGCRLWKCELHLTYPEGKVFETNGTRLRDAENIAAVKALQWLIQEGIINNNRKLVQYTKDDEMKLKELHQAPSSISIPQALQDKMKQVISELEEKRTSLVNIKPVEVSEEACLVMHNVITENIYYEPSAEELGIRSRQMLAKAKILENKKDPAYLEIKKVRSTLPIVQKREHILNLINENQVVVLSGETGCGKSTQVPQYILEHYVNEGRGAECNIVVTQPRRISALSIAERVAKERGEQVGQTVGHQIRLNRRLPSNSGAILYCTTGVILRKICSNPNLEGVSHIIVDEVHERSIHIDFLLILLKRMIENNSKIKIVLMSASFNTQMFSKYFNNCPVINVPGKIFPVKEYFLEDLTKYIPHINLNDHTMPKLNNDLVINTIKHIHETQPPGAILCFLPGWYDIRTAHTELLKNQDLASSLFICPLHSRLPPAEQKNIFKTPAEGKRKVILSTNVAETSITVDDVVYVINSGLHKGTILDVEAGISSLAVQWITKANVRQRRGRAGRVQPGVCYHLFSRKTLMEMNEYPIAEILRVPLEKTILDCKDLKYEAVKRRAVHYPEMKAEEFLSKALQPPSPESVQSGINDLISMKILEENEELTDLGRVILQFGTHPRLSTALIYASFLGCIDPVLTICAILTLEKEPFINTLDEKFHIKKIKEMFDNGLCSDHLALNKLYEIWYSLTEEKDIAEFLEKYSLDEQSLILVKSLKELFAEDLQNIGVLKGRQFYTDRSIECNVSSTHSSSILTALAAAFFPNVIRINQGEISHGKLLKDSLVYSLIKGQKAYIQKQSVACDQGELPNPWLVFFSAMKSEARRLAMVPSVSCVPGISLLMLAGKELSIQTDTGNDQNFVLVIDDYKKLNFSCTQKEARLLLDWRECWQNIFVLYLRNLKEWNSEEHEFMLFCRSKFMKIMKELLETPQVPFTKGQTYEFIENNLVVKNL